MVIVYKRIATTDGDYTQNQDYTVVLATGGVVYLLNDGGNLQGQSVSELNNSSLWQKVSITVAGSVSIYP